MALDLNGAFKAVLPDKLVLQLVELEGPSRIVNFIIFLTAKRLLSFSAGDHFPSPCGVGVP